MEEKTKVTYSDEQIHNFFNGNIMDEGLVEEMIAHLREDIRYSAYFKSIEEEENEG